MPTTPTPCKARPSDAVMELVRDRSAGLANAETEKADEVEAAAARRGSGPAAAAAAAKEADESAVIVVGSEASWDKLCNECDGVSVDDDVLMLPPPADPPVARAGDAATTLALVSVTAAGAGVDARELSGSTLVGVVAATPAVLAAGARMVDAATVTAAV